jgi:predicted DNA-binding protein with PD1-like motif
MFGLAGCATYATRLRAQSSAEDIYVKGGPVLARGVAPGLKWTNLSATGRQFELVFAKGDEVTSGLTEFAEKNHIVSAHITAFGAFNPVTLGWSDPARKAYRRIQIDEEVELASMIGELTMQNGKTNLHAHVVVGLSDGTSKAGHLLEGHVSLTLRALLVETDTTPAATGK